MKTFRGEGGEKRLQVEEVAGGNDGRAEGWGTEHGFSAKKKKKDFIYIYIMTKLQRLRVR